MNKTLTSREAILSVGKEIAIESGLQALNMRDVAKRCGVAVGSIYNYFPSKGDLIVATIESIWTEIMHDSKGCNLRCNFTENIQGIFYNAQNGCKKYPSFFSAHSMSIANIDRNKGREAMNRYFAHIKNGLLEVLKHDKEVKKDAFSEKFTQLDFVDFVLSNIITLLIKDAKSCDILLEIVKRIIY